MKKTELRKHGEKLCERDFYNNGCYAGTNCYYLHNNRLYCIQEVDNSMNYNGRSITSCLCFDIKSEIRDTTDLYWQVDMGLTRQGYEKLCAIYGREPSCKFMDNEKGGRM